MSSQSNISSTQTSSAVIRVSCPSSDQKERAHLLIRLGHRFLGDQTRCLLVPTPYEDNVHTALYMKPRTIYKADTEDYWCGHSLDGARGKDRYPDSRLIRFLSRDVAHGRFSTKTNTLRAEAPNCTKSGCCVSVFEVCALKFRMYGKSRLRNNIMEDRLFHFFGRARG